MPGIAERAQRIIREHYADFGPTLACEARRDPRSVSGQRDGTQLMTQAGLWIPRKLRPPRVHQPHPRRSCTGELIQIDGSEHCRSRIVVRFTWMLTPTQRRYQTVPALQPPPEELYEYSKQSRRSKESANSSVFG